MHLFALEIQLFSTAYSQNTVGMFILCFFFLAILSVANNIVHLLWTSEHEYGA
jgi:hypothetical protein